MSESWQGGPAFCQRSQNGQVFTFPVFFMVDPFMVSGCSQICLPGTGVINWWLRGSPFGVWNTSASSFQGNTSCRPVPSAVQRLAPWGAAAFYQDRFYHVSVGGWRLSYLYFCLFSIPAHPTIPEILWDTWYPFNKFLLCWSQSLFIAKSSS